MPLAWPDEESVAGDDEFWDDADVVGLSDDTIAVTGTRCGGVIAWLADDVNDAVSQVVSAGESRPIWPLRASSTMHACSWWSDEMTSAAQRHWELLRTIQFAVDELDDAPIPRGSEVTAVAGWLGSLSQRLVRLEHALPVADSELAEPDESKHAVVVDWRALNKDQALGLPKGLLAEDGTTQLNGSAIKHFAVFAEEADFDDRLPE